MASTIQVRIPRGNTSIRTFQAYDGDEVFILSGFTVEMIIKASETASDGDDDSVTIDGDVTNAAQGLLSVTIPDDNTGTAGTRWYRIDAVSTGGERATVACGPFIIDPV